MKLQLAVLGLTLVLFQVEGRSVEPSPLNNALVLTPLQEECVKEHNLNDKRADIAHINSRAICPEDNPEYNKFISCFWIKTDRQKKNGEMNWETLKSFVREGISQALGNHAVAQEFAERNSQKIVAECQTIKDDDTAKLAAKVRNCIVRGLEQVGEQ